MEKKKVTQRKPKISKLSDDQVKAMAAVIAGCIVGFYMILKEDKIKPITKKKVKTNTKK